jgi:hypothetical protein
VVGRPRGTTVRIQGVELPAGRGHLLSDASMVTVRPGEGATELTFEHELDGTYTPAAAVPHGRST